jgi:arylsulfatase A-like enzyme
MWDVHYDYTPPEEYVRMFDGDYAGKLDGTKIYTTGFKVGRISSRGLAHLLARYDGEIRSTDDTLGRMLAALDEAGHLEDTLVIVTSDHGDEFLEHHGKGHMRTVFQEVVHVPLVMWAGRRLPAGHVVETPVRLSDVVPTVLDVLGIESPAPLDGRSLVPALRGEPLPAVPAISELYGGSGRAGIDVVIASIRKGDTKLVQTESTLIAKQPASWVEYELAHDPHELSPRPVTHRTLQARLTRYLSTTKRRLVAKRSKPGQGGEIPAHVADQLKALGYVD